MKAKRAPENVNDQFNRQILHGRNPFVQDAGVKSISSRFESLQCGGHLRDFLGERAPLSLRGMDFGWKRNPHAGREIKGAEMALHGVKSKLFGQSFGYRQETEFTRVIRRRV